MPIPPHQTTNPKTTPYFFTASMDDTALAQRLGEGLLDRADQAGVAVGDDQQRRAQAAVGQVSQEVMPGVGGLGRAREPPELTARPAATRRTVTPPN
jgi:hypothetical protein